jgi:hypothetical protein
VAVVSYKDAFAGSPRVNPGIPGHGVNGICGNLVNGYMVHTMYIEGSFSVESQIAGSAPRLGAVKEHVPIRTEKGGDDAFRRVVPLTRAFTNKDPTLFLVVCTGNLTVVDSAFYGPVPREDLTQLSELCGLIRKFQDEPGTPASEIMKHVSGSNPYCALLGIQQLKRRHYLTWSAYQEAKSLRTIEYAPVLVSDMFRKTWFSDAATQKGFFSAYTNLLGGSDAATRNIMLQTANNILSNRLFNASNGINKDGKVHDYIRMQIQKSEK